ncbi:hypothetical protein CTAM01_00188 [Colletotrichum tamarilloi]|uniref:Uncharacterized protein n=1 Tax=Colletotrichum tamarilloi TaxID=1209934 RepID=A0ABQ9RTV9_9PEZI|nr:uncharacterized protein CTAM01_00188 [Colletotrichum tamarilloi]KAK1512793.1 hypothetical protein CTAM01_00188 [Colletotrichum tamarilloi]
MKHRSRTIDDAEPGVSGSSSSRSIRTFPWGAKRALAMVVRCESLQCEEGASEEGGRWKCARWRRLLRTTLPCCASRDPDRQEPFPITGPERMYPPLVGTYNEG